MKTELTRNHTFAAETGKPVIRFVFEQTERESYSALIDILDARSCIAASLRERIGYGARFHPENCTGPHAGCFVVSIAERDVGKLAKAFKNRTKQIALMHNQLANTLVEHFLDDDTNS